MASSSSWRMNVKLLFVVLVVCASLPLLLSLFITSGALLKRVNCVVLQSSPPGIVHNPETLSAEDFSNQYLSLSDRVEGLKPGEKLVEAFFKYLEPKRVFTTRKSVLIAVITTEKYLLTRVRAIHKTWGQDIDSDSELYFFVGEDCNTKHPFLKDLPIIKLEGVSDDVYPPQKKVFSVLSHLQSNFGEKFKWFVRADDDLYIRVWKIKAILRKFNWTDLLYMGHPGLGLKKDRRRLKLLSHENYCMGGTGVVLSAPALKAVSPHLGLCLKAVELYNSRWVRDMGWYNEDVELGRCISRTLGIGCSLLPEVRLTVVRFLLPVYAKSIAFITNSNTNGYYTAT